MLQELNPSHQNDICDNVKYAMSIQSVILPNERKLRSLCPNSFSIYRPQGFVSGDFYWFEKNQSKLTVLLGDSTGHGVSASFISIIILSALETLKKYRRKVEDPKLVLEYLNSHLFSFLKKDKGSSLFESAEMASCTIDFKEKTLTYASAGITILTSRKGEIIRLPKNKTSVGSCDEGNFKVETFTHDLIAGEQIFIMSDGLQDQHGGSSGKRIGSKKIQTLLNETAFLNLAAQKNVLELFLNNWQKKYDQTDDISFIAIAIPE